MATVAKNVKAIQTSIRLTQEAAEDERNAILRNYWRGLPRNVGQNLIYTHGRRAYRDKTLEQFLSLIEGQPISWNIQYLGGDDNRYLAAIANEMYNLAFRQMLADVDTGKHLASLQMLVREIGSPIQGLVSDSINWQQLPDRAEITLIATVEYASTLEHLGAIRGYLYYTALKIRQRYSPEINVRYDYAPSASYVRVGATSKYSIPRIRIGFEGNVRRRAFKRPGRYAKRTPRFENI